MKSLIKENKMMATVQSVRWERIFMYLDVRVETVDQKEKVGKLEFYAVNELYYATAKFKVIGVEGNIYHLKLNVTNNGENECVPSGEYRIIVCQNGCQMSDCETDTDIVADMPDFSRTFLYATQTKSYTITFYVEEDADTLPFRFLS